MTRLLLWLLVELNPPHPHFFLGGGGVAEAIQSGETCVVDRQCPGQSGWQDYYYYYCWLNWTPLPPTPTPRPPFLACRGNTESEKTVLCCWQTAPWPVWMTRLLLWLLVELTPPPPPHAIPLVCWGNTESEETVLCCWQTVPWPVWMTRLLLWLLVELTPPPPPQLLWFVEATLRVRRLFCVVDRQRPGQSGWQDCWQMAQVLPAQGQLLHSMRESCCCVAKLIWQHHLIVTFNVCFVTVCSLGLHIFVPVLHTSN